MGESPFLWSDVGWAKHLQGGFNAVACAEKPRCHAASLSLLFPIHAASGIHLEMEKKVKAPLRWEGMH